jgi:hypothetical protein
VIAIVTEVANRFLVICLLLGKQNDVAECMDNCIFQIEAALQFDPEEGEIQGAERPNIVKRYGWINPLTQSNHILIRFFRLFYGKKRQRIWPAVEEGKPEPAVSEKEDIFAQLLVNVSDDGFDLYDGLGGFLDDTVEFEGKKAKMEVDLVELPPILQIQLQVSGWLCLCCGSVCHLNFTVSAYNSIDRHYSPRRTMPMSSLAKHYSWIDSWSMRIRRRGPSRVRSRPICSIVAIEL